MVTYEEIDLLVKNGKKEEALQLLYDIKRTKTLTVDETGWMYWNISDIPAVMRKPQEVIILGKTPSRSMVSTPRTFRFSQRFILCIIGI